MEVDLVATCVDLREKIRDLGTMVYCLKTVPAPAGSIEDEVRANLVLSYRHLEDARMRLGKVIQNAEGGVSIFDK